MFSSKMMDEKRDVSEVPMKYRMLFIHKYVANIPRLNNTFLLAMCVSILFLVDMFGWKWEWTLCAVCFMVVYTFVRFVVMKNLGKRRIGKACRELLENGNTPDGRM